MKQNFLSGRSFHDDRDLAEQVREWLSQQIEVLYETAQQTPRADFVTALELAEEQQMHGAEDVRAIPGRQKRAAPLGAVQGSGTKRPTTIPSPRSKRP